MFDHLEKRLATNPERSSSTSLNRRRFLASTVALACSASAIPATAADRGPVNLIPNPAHQLFRVRVELEVEGNANIARNPLVSRKIDNKLPLQSTASFDYEERFRLPDDHRPAADRPDKATPLGYITYAERYYHSSSVKSQLNKYSHAGTLRPTVCQTVVRRETLPETIYAVEDYFSQDELDLLRLPLSSVGIDGLLPTQAVSPGDRYQPDHDALASTLNLTAIESSDVEANIISITDDEAKIQIKGKIDGSIDGVPTVLRTVGKLTFDRKVGACTWLAMAIHETRDIGVAEPGFDVAATIRMLRKPMTAPVGLPAKRPEIDVTTSIPADRMFVDLQSEKIHVAALMDRQWRMMSDLPETAMMRMTQDDRSVAQCDFRRLPSLQAGNQWTLEAFSADVQRTLGDQLQQILEADQRVSATGLRVLRVAAAGSVEGVPIQWILLHFSNDEGRRVLATFTLEEDHLPRFAGSDLQLADSLRFLESPQASSADVAEKPSSEAEKSGSPRIADAILGEKKQNEVQSSSDTKF